LLTSLLLCLSVASAGAAAAKDSSTRKLGRGVANVGLGVLALPGEVVDTTREKGPFLGATWGVVKGVGMTAVTELVGVWEVMTCVFQVPPGWKPILSPEFPWQHFQKERSAEPPSRPPPPRVR
jgi:putative exosortase-associated protein (TIGR04073 family)